MEYSLQQLKEVLRKESLDSFGRGTGCADAHDDWQKNTAENDVFSHNGDCHANPKTLTKFIYIDAGLWTGECDYCVLSDVLEGEEKRTQIPTKLAVDKNSAKSNFSKSIYIITVGKADVTIRHPSL